MSDFLSAFDLINQQLDSDAEQREQLVKILNSLSRLARANAASLQSMHSQCATKQQLEECANQAALEMRACHEIWRTFEATLRSSSLHASVPTSSASAAAVAADSIPAVASAFEANAEKHHDLYRYTLQQLVASAALSHFLLHEQLLSIEQAAQLIGLNELKIDLEDYLFAISSLPSELSRLARNLMRCSNFSFLPSVAQFIHDLYAGFRLLNLRNDALRRKIDSIKYDVLRVEEIMYDFALHKKSESASARSETAENDMATS